MDQIYTFTKVMNIGYSIIQLNITGRFHPMASDNSRDWHGTTILAVRKGGTVVIGGDGQTCVADLNFWGTSLIASI